MFAWFSQSQLDLLVRLRIIEQLQAYSCARIATFEAEDPLIDILNWISYCLVRDDTSCPVAVALSACLGQVTLFVTTTVGTDQSMKSSLIHSVNTFLGVLREVLSDDFLSPELATRAFVRMVIRTSLGKIQQKICLVGRTGESPLDTSYRLNTLLSFWLIFRPEGEQSAGFINMAITCAGDAKLATDYLIKALTTLLQHDELLFDDMTTEEINTHIFSAITACDLLVNSTFFNDFLRHQSFKASLKAADRIFIHKVLRRIQRIAAYKTGALQFAYLGVPFLRHVLGHRGLSQFLNGTGGIFVEYVTDVLANVTTPLSADYTWPMSPMDILPFILSIEEEDEDTPKAGGIHSRGTSSASTTSSSTTSSNISNSLHLERELSQLDLQLRSQLLNSEILAEAWSKGGQIHSRFHCELQLVHYLQQKDLDVTCQAIGTSKPMCWACCLYLDSLARNKSPGAPDEDTPLHKWWHSQGSGKVYSDWMIPPFGRTDAVHAVLDQAHEDMERIVDEVAFDCYL